MAIKCTSIRYWEYLSVLLFALLHSNLAFQSEQLHPSSIQVAYPTNVAYYSAAPASPAYILTVYPGLSPDAHSLQSPFRFEQQPSESQSQGVFYPVFTPYPWVGTGYNGYAGGYDPGLLGGPNGQHSLQPIAYHLPAQQAASGIIPASPANVDLKPVERNSQPSLAAPLPAPVPEEFVATFRGAGTSRARATLKITKAAADNRLAEVYFYQPTPNSDVFVAVTGTSGNTNGKDIVVLTGDTTVSCTRQPAAADNNPVFNPRNIANGGVIATALAAPGMTYAYTTDRVSPDSITLWGSRTIVGRYILVAATNTIPGAGTAELCGKIVAL